MTGDRPVLIRIDNLTKRFGGVTAVDGITLDVRSGEFLTFLGSSGSGKTTTLFIVAGFEDPTSGDVLIDGRSILRTPPHKRNIGMVFQSYTLFPHLTAFENVAFPLSVRRRSKTDIATAVHNVLRLVRLDGLAERKPNQLSGGQRQRVALARALVYEPRFLLMDEPLGALDKRLREEIQVEIRRIHHELGVTILYVTHDQDEALRMSDRIAVFTNGKIAQVGTGEDLYERPASAFVGSFLGNSNFMDAVVTETRDSDLVVQLPNGQFIKANRGHRVAPGGGASLMIRPEKMLVASDAGHVATDCALRVRITDAAYVGDAILYEVVTPWQQSLMVRQTPGLAAMAQLSVGAEVNLLWRSDDVHVFAADESLRGRAGQPSARPTAAAGGGVKHHRSP